MRTPLVAGNWKMNTLSQSAAELAGGIVSAASGKPVDVLVCPPAIYLSTVASSLGGSAVALGAQNVYHEETGAFTGEVSPQMLLDVGCRYAIIGHSERRQIFGETDAQVNQKTKASLAAGLLPIVCVGETLQQREAGQTSEVVNGQCTQSLADLTEEQMRHVTIAYEPVWAIGTGKVATPQQAQDVHADLRKLLKNQYNAELASVVRILYGGSVKPDNAAELLGQVDIDGALVGGASLKADAFAAIIEAAAGVAV